MRTLLDAGANPALKQKDQTTVLMLAAGAGWRTGETIPGRVFDCLERRRG